MCYPYNITNVLRIYENYAHCMSSVCLSKVWFLYKYIYIVIVLVYVSNGVCICQLWCLCKSVLALICVSNGVHISQIFIEFCYKKTNYKVRQQKN